MEYYIYKYRRDRNNEIHSISLSRGFRTLEEAMKYFNRFNDVDLVDYHNGKEYIKRSGEVTIIEERG